VRICIHLLIRICFAVYHRFAARNTQVLRGLRAACVVANHSSHLDVLAIQSAFPLGRVNEVRSLAAKEYFFTNAIIRGISFFLANTIPLARGRYDAAAFGFVRQQLAAGAMVILFPEGKRSMDGRMEAFKPGIGMIALRMGVPVVPAYIFGAHESLGKMRFVPRPRKIEVVFGEPVVYEHIEDTKESWKQIAADLEQRVRALGAPLEQVGG